MRKDLCQSLFFNIKKKTLAQVFFCEFCEIFKNKYYTEHIQTSASRKSLLILHKMSSVSSVQCNEVEVLCEHFLGELQWNQQKIGFAEERDNFKFISQNMWHGYEEKWFN